MFGKKSVSAVVAVVMIILVTVTAVTILWVAVIPMVQERVVSSEELGTNVRISTQDGYTTWYSDGSEGEVCLQVKRGADEADISKIIARIEVGGESFEEEFENVPVSNSAVSQCFRNVNYVNEPDSVSIFPVFNLNGNARKGSVTSEISGSKLPEASGFVEEAGCVPVDEIMCDGIDQDCNGEDLQDLIDCAGNFDEEGLWDFGSPCSSGDTSHCGIIRDGKFVVYDLADIYDDSLEIESGTTYVVEFEVLEAQEGQWAVCFGDDTEYASSLGSYSFEFTLDDTDNNWCPILNIYFGNEGYGELDNFRIYEAS